MYKFISDIEDEYNFNFTLDEKKHNSLILTLFNNPKILNYQLNNSKIIINSDNNVLINTINKDLELIINNNEVILNIYGIYYMYKEYNFDIAEKLFEKSKNFGYIPAIFSLCKLYYKEYLKSGLITYLKLSYNNYYLALKNGYIILEKDKSVLTKMGDEYNKLNMTTTIKYNNWVEDLHNNHFC